MPARTVAENETLVEGSQDQTRRNFLGKIWAGLGGLAVLEICVLLFTYMKPRLKEGDFGNVITVGPAADFPPGSVTPVPTGRFYLAHINDGGFLAIYQRCTHLGCTVPWVATENKFICPCHNSQFEITGEVLSPPAPRPLDLFHVSIEDGVVKVDTRKIISRDHYERSQAVKA